MPTFYSRFEKALRVSATASSGGRLQGEAQVILADVANPAVTRTAKSPYELFGPGDVQRLAAGAITRRFPAPFASNAEVTKVALVEFAAPDLPWRYTPELAGSARLRPWLVLVVGQRAPGDVILRPDGRVSLGLVAQGNHVLTDSWRWAHAHEVEGHEPIARLVAPPVKWPDPEDPGIEHYGYLADTQYVACVVPAFTATGAESWNGSAPATCDLYDWWTFRTGPEGDFPDLAKKLHKAELAQIPGGKPFGRAEVSYRSRTMPAVTTVLHTAGALRLPPDPDTAPDPVDLPPVADIRQETAALTGRITTPDGRRVITAPRYDAPFADANAGDVPVSDGWMDQLCDDPRLRGAAALGAWAAIEWQDRISDAAAAKAGDLGIADDRIRHVALGVEASRSLWRRRLPPLPADRLAILLPALGRMVTTTGTSALDEIAGRTPQLTRGLLSSAARRALRPGPARTALAANGREPFGAALVAANECASERDPAEIRPARGNSAAAIKQAVFDAAGGDEELAVAVLRHLGENPSAGALEAAFRALAPGVRGTPDREVVDRFLHIGEFPQPDQSLLEWTGWMSEHAFREPCEPVDLVGLAGLVAGAIDPTVERPPAVERVLSTLPGIKGIGPVEIEPELDLPLWSFLSDRAPDWMLPGAGDLLDGDVVALSTNPIFVESLLVGANHQATVELRWRNIPLVTRWSPLRKFWQRSAGDVDILPIKSWPAADPLGSATLVPPERTAEAVVVFRTSLFRRYPATVVYLYPAQPGWIPPKPEDDLNLERIPPTFTGSIGKDITFFGFKLAPEDLKTHWVVLEEPPAGYRFYHEADSPLPPPGHTDSDAANFAFSRFAVPVRVLIGQLLSDAS